MKRRDPGHPGSNPWTHKCVHDPFPLGMTPNGRVGVQINCGKPQALVMGVDGVRRFPDHAAVSRRVWIEAGGDEAIGDLIGMDMDMHLLKDEGVAEFSQRPQARVLVLTALSEVHANASMFGGLESTSFKIKRKHVDKRGRAILKAIRAKEDLPMAA